MLIFLSASWIADSLVRTSTTRTSYHITLHWTLSSSLYSLFTIWWSPSCWPNIYYFSSYFSFTLSFSTSFLLSLYYFLSFILYRSLNISISLLISLFLSTSLFFSITFTFFLLYSLSSFFYFHAYFLSFVSYLPLNRYGQCVRFNWYGRGKLFLKWSGKFFGAKMLKKFRKKVK